MASIPFSERRWQLRNTVDSEKEATEVEVDKAVTECTRPGMQRILSQITRRFSGAFESGLRLQLLYLHQGG